MSERAHRPQRPGVSCSERYKRPLFWTRLGCIPLLASIHFVACLEAFAGVHFASLADVSHILRDERFELVHDVRQISARDWASTGVLPQGRNITSSMVNPGEAYQSADFGTGKLPLRQLLVAAKNGEHEVLCFWQGSQGGPWLHVMMIERRKPKSALIFSAIMNNDIAHDKWTGAEIKRHVIQGKMEILISAEHPGAYDNRLP